jgi:hypothetical protein
LNDFPITFDKSVEQQIAEAEKQFLNTNEVDNLLNIVESPQLPASIHSLQETVKGTAVTRALRKISNGYLLWSFGLAPLISDMRKMQKVMKTIKSDMAKALSQAGKQVTVYNKTSGFVTPYSSAAPHHDSARWDHSGRVTRTVALRGVNTVAYSSPIMGQLNYLMSRFGSNGPASYLWERIPFSFVLDWFVDLKSITNGLDNLLTGNSKSISGCLATTKGSFSAVMTDTYGSHVPRGFQGTQVATTLISLYRREAPTYHGFSVNTSGRFGKKQLALSAALLYQLVASRLKLTKPTKAGPLQSQVGT